MSSVENVETDVPSRIDGFEKDEVLKIWKEHFFMQDLVQLFRKQILKLLETVKK